MYTIDRKQSYSVERKQVQTRLRWIVALSLLILTFLFFEIDYTKVPVGQFGGKIEVYECSFKGITVIGVGETSEVARADLARKKLNYAHLYCNGKFPNDPPNQAISSLGCKACKPYCNPKIIDLSDISPGETYIGDVTLTQATHLNCL